MNWARLAEIVVGTGVVSSLTDWFFAGDWLHRRYTHPEIWRQGGEGRAIALTSPLTISDLWGLCLYHRPAGSSFCVGRGQAGRCGVADRPVAADPHYYNAAFMKLHRVFVASYATGWLVKLVIVAVAVGWFLR
jgi:hypothetical protein